MPEWDEGWQDCELSRRRASRCGHVNQLSRKPLESVEAIVDRSALLLRKRHILLQPQKICIRL